MAAVRCAFCRSATPIRNSTAPIRASSATTDATISQPSHTFGWFRVRTESGFTKSRPIRRLFGPRHDHSAAQQRLHPFRRPVGNIYFALHRPSSPELGGNYIWLSESPDLLHWGNHRCLAHNASRILGQRPHRCRCPRPSGPIRAGLSFITVPTSGTATVWVRSCSISAIPRASSVAPPNPLWSTPIPANPSLPIFLMRGAPSRDPTEFRNHPRGRIGHVRCRGCGR